MYGVIRTVPAPVETYDSVHAEMLRQVGDVIPQGAYFHVARAVPEGFQIIEVWESKAVHDQAMAQLVAPVLEHVDGGEALPPIDAGIEEFQVRGLVIPPSAGVAV
jgi:hypothetical protein